MKNYVKQGQKLPIFGVGPYIVFGMGVKIPGSEVVSEISAAA